MWIETTRTRALLARLCNSAASQGVGTTRRHSSTPRLRVNIIRRENPPHAPVRIGAPTYGPQAACNVPRRHSSAPQRLVRPRGRR